MRRWKWVQTVGPAYAGPVATLLLALLVVGCAPGTTMPPTASPVAVDLPAPTTAPTATQAPTLTTPGDPGRLVSQWASSPPAIDGSVEGAWAAAVPLHAALTWGMEGTAHALDVELRALHTDQSVYFLVRWTGGPPSGEEDTVSNKFTLHWRIPEPAAQRLDCEVACHTAHADGQGRFVYANAETIPPGGSEALPSAGGWDGDTWTMEWGRPLLNSNPFDLQFSDLDASYSFMVKVFERVEGRPDPVSARYALVFRR